MRIVKVLLLDDAPWFLPDLTRYDIKLHVMQEGTWGTKEVYSATSQICETVKRLTEGKEVDMIVVGNNLGSGVSKSEAIAEHMKAMTIVVWNSYIQGSEAPYAALGLTRFGSRSDLGRMIPELLGIAC